MVQPTPADIDYVRLLVGDPAGASQALTDGQITTLLTANNLDRYAAAADCADALAALYAKRVDTRVGILSSSDSQLAKQYHELAASLRRRGAVGRLARLAPWAGGVRKADREARVGDDTLASPFFVRPDMTAAANEELC